MATAKNVSCIVIMHTGNFPAHNFFFTYHNHHRLCRQKLHFAHVRSVYYARPDLIEALFHAGVK